MKKFISIIMILAFCFSAAYVATSDEAKEYIKAFVANQNIFKSDEDKINDTLDKLESAFQDGDMEGVMNTFSIQEQAKSKALFGIAESYIPHFDANLFFSAGVGIGDMQIKFNDRKINILSDEKAEVETNFFESSKVSAFITDQKSEKTYPIKVIMVKENGKWFISNITQIEQ